MKIRLMGTREETDRAAELIAHVLNIREISEFYANRGASVLGRVYLDVEIPPETPPQKGDV